MLEFGILWHGGWVDGGIVGHFIHLNSGILWVGGIVGAYIVGDY